MGIRRGWYSSPRGDTLAQLTLERHIRDARRSLRRWMHSGTYKLPSPTKQKVIYFFCVAVGITFYLLLALN